MLIWLEKIPWTYETFGQLVYNSPDLAVSYDDFWYLRVAEEIEKDSFNITDLNHQDFDYIVRDDIVISEDGYYTHGKFAKDSLKITDNTVLDVDVKKNESINVTDKYLRSVDKIDKELFFTKDKHYRDVDIKKNESVDVKDNQYRDVDIKKTEVVNVKDKSLRDVDRYTKMDKFFVEDPFYRDEYEDEDGNIIENNKQDNVVADLTLFDFEIIDRPLLPKPNGNIDESENNFEDFATNNAPLGYGPLRPFYPGEYEYKDAVVGFTLAIHPTNGRFGVIGSKVYADVEDVVDKGTIEVNANELTQIKFSKRFYTIPQVQAVVIWAQGNIGTNVEIKEITRTGFKVGIRSLETTQLVAGEINWLADGY